MGSDSGVDLPTVQRRYTVGADSDVDLSTVQMYVVRFPDGRVFEAICLEHPTHTEMHRVIQTSGKGQQSSAIFGRPLTIDRMSSEWMAVHSVLARNGKLRGEEHDNV